MNPTLATLAAISLIVIAVILVVILLFFIPALLQVRRTARETEKLVDSLRMEVVPISRDVGFISKDIRGIIESVRRQMNRVEDGIETVCDMATRAKDFQNGIQQKIEQPLVQIAAIMAGMQRGIEVMRRVFRR